MRFKVSSLRKKSVLLLTHDFASRKDFGISNSIATKALTDLGPEKGELHVLCIYVVRITSASTFRRLAGKPETHKPFSFKWQNRLAIGGTL